jgi:plastocyanin
MRHARFLFAALLIASPATAATLSGAVTLLDRGRPAADVQHAVVSWTPAGGVRTTPRGDHVIRTQDKRFLPRVLPVTVGSTVAFPNGDPILHNVFSVSPARRFDLGLYRKGEGKSVTFDQPGLVRVYCNVHHAMIAYVAVLETPHFTMAGAEGRFTLEVPDGPGTLTVWHERATPFARELASPTEAADVRMDATIARLPSHTDKHGRPYEPGREARYR